MTNISQLGNKLSEQKITQRIIVDANSSGEAEIEIPTTASVYLKGYGYTWYANQVYTLHAGTTIFPSRSDQEGSITQPVIYGNPFFCNSGGTLKLVIENNDGSAHTYDVVFYILTTEILDVQSSGSDLTFNTGLNITSNINAIAQLNYPTALETIGVVQNMYDLDSSTYFEIRCSPNNVYADYIEPKINFSFPQSKTIQGFNYDVDLVNSSGLGLTNTDLLVGFNSTGNTSEEIIVNTRIEITGSDSTTSRGGIHFVPFKNMKLTSIKRDSTSTATMSYVRDSTGVIIASANFSVDASSRSIFSPEVQLTEGVEYILDCDNSGASYTRSHGQTMGGENFVIWTAGYSGIATNPAGQNIESFRVKIDDFEVIDTHSSGTNLSNTYTNFVTDKIYFASTGFLKIKQVNIFT